MKQITIYDLLPLLKKGWVAMNANGRWFFYNYKPKKGHFGNYWYMSRPYEYALNLFNIAPFDGDWKDSLIKVEHKEEE